MPLREKFVRVFYCRVGGRPATLAVGFHGGSAPAAFDIHLEHCCVMNKSVHRREEQGGVEKEPVPFSMG